MLVTKRSQAFVEILSGLTVSQAQTNCYRLKTGQRQTASLRRLLKTALTLDSGAGDASDSNPASGILQPRRMLLDYDGKAIVSLGELVLFHQLIGDLQNVIGGLRR